MQARYCWPISVRATGSRVLDPGFEVRSGSGHEVVRCRARLKAAVDALADAAGSGRPLPRRTISRIGAAVDQLLNDLADDRLRILRLVDQAHAAHRQGPRDRSQGVVHEHRAGVVLAGEEFDDARGQRPCVRAGQIDQGRRAAVGRDGRSAVAPDQAPTAPRSSDRSRQPRPRRGSRWPIDPCRLSPRHVDRQEAARQEAGHDVRIAPLGGAAGLALPRHRREAMVGGDHDVGVAVEIQRLQRVAGCPPGHSRRS